MQYEFLPFDMNSLHCTGLLMVLLILLLLPVTIPMLMAVVCSVDALTRGD